MTKPLLARCIFVFLVVIFGIVVITEYPYIRDRLSASSGLTAKQASQVVPVPKNIRLKAYSTKEGILLNWTAAKDISGDYYDIFRKTPDTAGGWGERIGRINLRTDFFEPYEYTDKEVEVDHTYIYQIILIRL